jgi:NADPH-dependent glutamate synthase beta subunit-like oxidoreductase
MVREVLSGGTVGIVHSGGTVGKVYAGGDIVGGEGTVIEAMGMAKKAAKSIIDRLLKQ